MALLDQLTSVTGLKSSNDDVVEQCLATPALLHSVAEGLRMSSPKVRLDCAAVFAGVVKRMPGHVAPFANDLIEASTDKSPKLATLTLSVLAQIVPYQPADVFAARDRLIALCKSGGDTVTVAVLSVLAQLCAHNTNYRGKLIIPMTRILSGISALDKMATYIKALQPAVVGSLDTLKRFESAIAQQRANMRAADNEKLTKLITKFERLAVTKK